MSDNPLSALSLLKSGVRITFSDFSYIQGFPLRNCIRLKNKNEKIIDTYALTEDGMVSALSDLKSLQKTNKL
jgi:hypothetical protein